MILTVTPNPLLERRLHFDVAELGNINRAGKETFYAGGKGINVSRQLNHLKIKNSALTFLGGSNGKILRKALIDEGIDFNAVSIKDETRYSSVIVEEKKKRVTSFFSPNNEILNAEVEQFIEKMDKAIQNCSIVVFAGSSPNKEAQKIFTEGIALANKYDKIAVLDTYGSHLEKCLSLSPFCIHNNLNELRVSLNLSLNNESGIESFLDSIYSKGIKHAYLTDGEKEFYSSKFDFHYKIKPVKVDIVDAVGSGDTFVAGIVYGIEKALVYEDALKFATALAALNCTKFDAANVHPDETENLIDKIDITHIGKKMKLIDDSPNY